jgi:predicted DNA-binding helix-hairpin-helix protein
MRTIVIPDAQQKMQLLAPLVGLECDGEPAPFDRLPGPEARTGRAELTPRQQAKRDFLAEAVVQVQRPDGPLTVLRTMQSSACERNCNYCPFRAGRSGMARVSFTPDELAREFDRMQRAGVVQGLFLSSGIVGGGVRAMDPMLATVELIRRKYAYRGYVHLKIMPGAERGQVEQAVRLADRVSINLEGVDASRLAYLAPQKDFAGELLPAMGWFHEVVGGQGPSFDRPRSPFDNLKALPVKTPSLVTQFVVGPAGESDRELLTTVDYLYRQVRLARAYYSGFDPVPDTPLADVAPTSALREHRLYQADWLLRFYGFALDELPFEQDGGLPAGVDPKLAWARKHLVGRPVEVNRASRAELLRVPGIGPRSADAILRARSQSRLRDLADLRALGAVANRAAPFILLDGKCPPHQLGLWDQI